MTRSIVDIYADLLAGGGEQRIAMRTKNSSFNLGLLNVPVKMTTDMGIDEEIAGGLKTSIINHTNTHAWYLVAEQTTQVSGWPHM